VEHRPPAQGLGAGAGLRASGRRLDGPARRRRRRRVVGFSFRRDPLGALQGFTLAYGLSAGLDPNKKVLGPKLDDLKAPKASYGTPIAYIEGAPRLAGNYIWASDKREIANTTTTGGKGGPGVDSTTFTYEIDVLIELAINRCQAIRRVWSNGKLVWSNGDDADDETLAASSTTNSWRDIRFYNGADDQLPDPTYEAAVGVGNAPAYRQRTTVMIEGLNLGGSGQLPVLSFEGDFVQSIAISSDGFVYALRGSGTQIYKLDVATLTLQATIAMPATGETVWVCYCDGTDLYVRGLGFQKYNGSGWDIIISPLPANLQLTSIDDQPGAVIDGVLWMDDTTSTLGGAPFIFQVYALALTLPAVAASLADVVSDLCLRTKQLEVSDFDVTALESEVVRSLAITQVAPTRATLEGLMAWYLFEWQEADGLVAINRGGSSVLTIPYADLGVSADGMAEPLAKKRLNDMEQAARVSVRYSNVLNDAQDGLEQADRLVTDSTAEVVVEAACGFTPTEAKRLAEANTLDLAVQLLQIGPIQLSPKYSRLQVADPFTVTGEDGSTFRVRGQQQTMNMGVISMQLVLDDASAISSTAETDSDYAASTLLKVISETTLAVLDIPLLRDLDDGLGQYVAIMPAGTKWSAARVDESSDDTNWGVVTTLATSTIIGEATTVLGDFAGFGVFDEVNSVTVNVGTNTLSSFTKDDAINGLAQPYLIGDEIVVPCTATFVSTGIYTLSTFLRGVRGTEWAIPDHAASEIFVVLQIPGMWKVDHELPDLNAISYFRATTLGRTPETTGEAHTDTGVAMKPYAPRDIHVDWTAPTTPTFSWRRRSRYASALFGTLALAEVSESYDIEIRNGLTLVESATVTTPEYTALADPTGYTFTVWQNSAVVGRGYPASLEL
jgi:hypothetical protein